jgi:hypothetical protein
MIRAKIFDGVCWIQRGYGGAAVLSGTIGLAEVTIVSTGAVVGISPGGNFVVRKAAGRERWLDLLECTSATKSYQLKPRKTHPNFLCKPSQYVLLHERLGVPSGLAAVKIKC